MIVSQERDDCGVCALGNVLDTSWQMAAGMIFGAEWQNRLRFNTTTRQIATALCIKNHKLIRVKSWYNIPDRSVVKVIPSACEGTGNWHWVVWRDGMVWDSNRSLPLAEHRYDHRLTSYLGSVK